MPMNSQTQERRRPCLSSDLLLPAKSPARSLLLVAMLIAAHSTASAQQDELSAMKQQLKLLQDRIGQLERERQQLPSTTSKTAPPGAGVVTAGDKPGSFKLPGSNTSVSIGGYVKGVGIWSDKSSGPASVGDETLFTSLIPVEPDGPTTQRNKVKFSAKESRLIVKTSTPTSYGEMTTLIEGDFFSSNGTELQTNGYGFRLRHAWATLGGLGVGQTWSNLVALNALPELIDFSPELSAFGGIRQAGVRYTGTLPNGLWSVALENPESYIAGVATDNDKGPDLNAKFNVATSLGVFELGGLLRKLRSNVPGSGSAWGGGLALSGGIPIGALDKLVFQVAHGKGVGRYWGAGTLSDAAVVNNKLEAITASGGYVGYRHFWTPTLRSNLDFSLVAMQNPDGSPGTLDKRLWSTHLNLIWALTPQVDLGVEYIKAKRRLENDAEGTLNRVLLMGKFTF